jgi:hypothetical protein
MATKPKKPMAVRVPMATLYEKKVNRMLKENQQQGTKKR